MGATSMLKAIETAIQATFLASKQITAPEHVAYLKSTLADSMQTLPPNGVINIRPELAMPGVYYFEVKFPYMVKDELEAFGLSWGKFRAQGLPKSLPRYYSTRAEKHYNKLGQETFIPFYLGKAMNVGERIYGHLHGIEDAKTYSLKLLSRWHLFDGCEVRYGAVTFDIDKAAYFSVALIETALRQELHPIIGSGRS